MDVTIDEYGRASERPWTTGYRFLTLFSHHVTGPMPTSLPRTVREHMGDEVADDFSRWFAENVQQELVTNDEYREVLSRLDVLEERFDHVDERFDRMEKQ